MSNVLITEIESKPWWSFSGDGIRDLLSESVLLYNESEGWNKRFHDFSFVVFPAAKAYEGYLKKVFLNKGFITDEDYNGQRFRIGKALNPSLEKEIRIKEGVYDKIVGECKGENLAKRMWTTWKSCRNLLFHFFPNEKNAISYEEAGTRLREIIDTFDAVWIGCNMK